MKLSSSPNRLSKKFYFRALSAQPHRPFASVWHSMKLVGIEGIHVTQKIYKFYM